MKPTINISAKNEYAFRNACENGYLEIAQWLEILFPSKYKIITYSSEKNLIRYKILQFLKINETNYVDFLEECPICMETLCELISICNHSYCENCILTHFETKNNCPICRKNIKNEGFCKLQINV